MGFLKRIGVILYMILMLGAGTVFFLIALDVFPVEQWTETINIIHEMVNYKITLGAVGGIFMILGVVAPFRVSKNLKSARAITFQNPDGEVTVSISAIEDYIHKVAKNIPDITNIRPRVSYGRRGINIVSDVGITAGSNIPEVIKIIQMEVKKKVQTMLGVEETINITVHVSKITGSMPVTEAEPYEETGPAHIPFR